MTHAPLTLEITGGIDTHRDTHTAAALDSAGRVQGTREFAATPAGFRKLLVWLRSWGTLMVVGIEGTGSYGAGLAGYLSEQNVEMVEVDRPDRKTRRKQGKSDPIDAIAAARAVLSGECTGKPKDRSGAVEALRNLRVARSSAVEQRSEVMRQIKALILTAPVGLRERLRELSTGKLITACVALRPDRSRIAEPEQAAKTALGALARRYQGLTAEIKDFDKLITPLITRINPRLLELTGVGPDVAGQMLVTAGQNPERLASEAALAMLCGIGPLPASSGRTDRHRLNRAGDRQANSAIHTVVINRMRVDQRTKDYLERRLTEGKTKKDIIRSLKRYVIREIYYVITANQNTPQPAKTPLKTAS